MSDAGGPGAPGSPQRQVLLLLLLTDAGRRTRLAPSEVREQQVQVIRTAYAGAGGSVALIDAIAIDVVAAEAENVRRTQAPATQDMWARAAESGSRR